MICAATWTVLERHFEGINWGDPADSVSILASDFAWHSVPEQANYYCGEGYLAYLGRWRKAFPAGWWELSALHGAAETMVCELIFRGVHTGMLETPLGFLVPTGHTLDLPMCEVFQIRAGRLASIHTYYDLATLVRQLGQTLGCNLRPLGMLQAN